MSAERDALSDLLCSNASTIGGAMPKRSGLQVLLIFWWLAGGAGDTDSEGYLPMLHHQQINHMPASHMVHNADEASVCSHPSSAEPESTAAISLHETATCEVITSLSSSGSKSKRQRSPADVLAVHLRHKHKHHCARKKHKHRDCRSA